MLQLLKLFPSMREGSLIVNYEIFVDDDDEHALEQIQSNQ